ncbi:MAG TPA: hypothetical protein VN515_08260 [Terriglobales bacterium]|nr:hypothetical protein [Terriglobales bacterium]
MPSGSKSPLLLALLVLAGGLAFHAPLVRAQSRDPLTPAEAGQVRDTAGKLDQRIPLLLKFAGERLARFEQIRQESPRPPGRDAQLYALLEEYKAILPEMDDAVSDAASGLTTSESDGKKFNLNKIVGDVIAADQGFATTLQHIQSASTPADLANYHFMLDDCLDVTADSLQNAKDSRPAKK